jgi:hypothetical protein
MRKGDKSIKVQLLRWWVKDRKLTPVERFSSRVGYMGVAFLISGQWTVEPILFMIGFCCVLFQVTVRKQWNLVLIDASLENIYMDCVLITGKSASMKSIIIDEVLKPHNFYFYENEGTIKVSSF